MAPRKKRAATRARPAQVEKAGRDGPAVIEFRGRRAKQVESQERRRAILEATLRLIVREGMRGVRHRAIAQEAGVPLAATTYYFKDLSDLIADAFNLYAEDTLRDSRTLEESSLAALEQVAGNDLGTPAMRAQLARTLGRHLAAHIREQVERRDERILEHAFSNEALRNEKLAATSRIPRARMLGAIAGFLTRCGSEDPEADAQIIFGFILSLEYQLLIGVVDEKLVTRTVTRLAQHIFGVSGR
jgi:TetR/AcrR family transcriptional regulator, regulator of biofilm formation and stress response